MRLFSALASGESVFMIWAALLMSGLAFSTKAQTVGWAKGLGGTGAETAQHIAIDGSGNVYITGYFNATADFDPGPGTANLTPVAGQDVFVCKLDASGNYVWAKSLGGAGVEQGYGIAVDGSGNVYICGLFDTTGDFDPGSGTANRTSAGGTDVFVSKLDASGNYVWAINVGGPGTEQGWGIAANTSNVYIVGIFNGTADFDPGSGTLNLTSAGSSDVFVSQLVNGGALPVTLRYVNGRMTEAGALLGWATVHEGNNAYFQIERSRDALSFEAIGTIPSQAAGGNSFTELTYSFTDAQPLPGVNYYRLTQTDLDGRRTLHKIIALSRENQPPVLFPNPVVNTNEVQLEPALAYTHYTLTDVLGRTVQHQSQPGTLNRLSVEGLSAGTYLLQVQTEEGPRTFRLLRGQ